MYNKNNIFLNFPSQFKEALSYEEQVCLLSKIVSEILEEYDKDMQNYITEWIDKNYNKLFFNAAYNSETESITFSRVDGIALNDVKLVSFMELLGEKLTIADKELRNKYKNTTTRNYILIADSYGLRPDEKHSWTGLTKAMLSQRGSKFYISNVGGAGFARVPVQFISQLQKLDSEIADNDSITDIVVCGGYNDNYYDVTTIKQAISDFIHECKTKFPNATVWIGFCGTTNKDKNTYKALMYNVYEAYASCVDYAAKFIDLGCVLHNNSLLVADGVHPNDTGSLFLGRAVTNSLIGANTKIALFTQYFRELPVDTYKYGTLSLRQRLDGNILSVNSIERCSIQLTGDRQVPKNKIIDIDLGKADQSFFYGSIELDSSIIPLTVKVATTSSKVLWLPATLEVNWESKHMWIHVLNVPENLTLVNVQGVSFSANVMQC